MQDWLVVVQCESNLDISHIIFLENESCCQLMN